MYILEIENKAQRRVNTEPIISDGLTTIRFAGHQITDINFFSKANKMNDDYNVTCLFLRLSQKVLMSVNSDAHDKYLTFTTAESFH